MNTTSTQTSEPEVYTLGLAAKISRKPHQTLNTWGRRGWIAFRRGSEGRGRFRLLDENGLLSIFVTDALRRSGASDETTVTAAAFLRTITPRHLEQSLKAGKFVLFIAGRRAMLLPPGGTVLNDTGKPILGCAAINLLLLVARVADAIDLYNREREVADSN